MAAEQYLPQAVGSALVSSQRMSARPAAVIFSDRLRRTARSVWTRVIVTLGLLTLVGLHLDWGDIEQRVRHGNPAGLLIAVGLIGIALIVGAYRWRALLIAAGVSLETRELARVYAVSTFSGTFLPTAVGGDVTRTLLVNGRGPLLGSIATTVLVDRFGGMIGLVGLAWVGVALQPASIPRGALVFLVWVSGGLILGTLMIIMTTMRSSKIARKLVPARLERLALNSRSLLRTYARTPRLLVLLVVSSIVFQALVAAQVVFLARAIGVHLPYATAAVTVTLVTVVTLIPISIGGFGVREGTYVVLLGAASVSASDATLISLMTVATLFIASLPGALMLVRRGLVPALNVGTDS
jgi:glycosyltransferase 2 family protein